MGNAQRDFFVALPGFFTSPITHHSSLITHHDTRSVCSYNVRLPKSGKTMSQKILSQIDADGNATVMLNRPEVHNAFDPEMVDALTATLKKLESNDKVRAIVITGAGRNFCAGADIEHMKKTAKFSRAEHR